MIKIKNITTLTGQTIDLDLPGEDYLIDAKGLTLLPALIDPDAHLENDAQAAVFGGFTTLFDMPDGKRPCYTKEQVEAKIQWIDNQLAASQIPLRYYLYIEAEENQIQEIGLAKKLAVGVSVEMGSSQTVLPITDAKALDQIFQIATLENKIIALHSEDEKILQENRDKYGDIRDPAIHSKIRDRKAAIKAVKKGIELTEKYGGQLLILHVSTKEELDLIRQAKQRELLVYAEVTPNHLFLTDKDYLSLGSKVLMNPPLRTQEDCEALWKGINDGTIDLIGSAHEPYSIEEKMKPYEKAACGVPGLETLLPLLLNALHEKKIKLEQIVALTRTNCENIFNLQPNEDFVLVDLNRSKQVRDEDMKTHCKWSPYSGKTLKGWPVYTISNGKVFNLTKET